MNKFVFNIMGIYVFPHEVELSGENLSLWKLCPHGNTVLLLQIDLTTHHLQFERTFTITGEKYTQFKVLQGGCKNV